MNSIKLHPVLELMIKDANKAEAWIYRMPDDVLDVSKIKVDTEEEITNDYIDHLMKAKERFKEIGNTNFYQNQLKSIKSITYFAYKQKFIFKFMNLFTKNAELDFNKDIIPFDFSFFSDCIDLMYEIFRSEDNNAIKEKTEPTVRPAFNDMADVITRILSELSELKRMIKGRMDYPYKKVEAEESDRLITIDEACKLLSVSRATLYHYGKQGKVNVYSIGGRRLLKKSEVFNSLTIKSK